MGMSGQLYASAALALGKSPGTHCIGGWVGPRAGLDDMERRKILPYESTARSQSLYRLRCPGVNWGVSASKNINVE
jgi:hypothetical protein